tara:strand:+ start:899 stop:4087 length:3189 start_codon:yes stop_codon:yes gene_type:complete
MADFDEIVIKNVGKDGVASEVTLQRLVSTLEKSKGLDDKSRKNLEGLARASKNTKESLKSFSDEIEKTTSIMEDVGNTLKKAFTLESFGKVLGFAAGTATNFGKEMAKGSVELGDFAQHIPVLGGSLGMLTQFFQDGLDTFRNLSDVGAGFGNSLIELRRQAASSGLNLDQFSSMISNNSDRLRLLGGTASQGAAQFSQLSKQLRVGSFGDKLMNMGYTMEELNEGLGDYIQLQSRNGTLQNMSQQQLVEGSQNYLTEIDKLARVTGQSRKAIAAEMQQNMQKANLQALMANMTEKQAIEFNAGLAAVRKTMPGFGDAIEDLADGIPQTALGKKLAALSPAVADAAAAFGRGDINSTEFMSSLKNVGGPALLEFVNGLDAGQRSALLQQEGFSELLGSVHQMRDFVNSKFDPKKAAEEQARQDKINTGMATFQQRIEEVRQKLVEAFITSGLADAVGSALVKFADLFLGMATAISDFVKDISDGNIITAIMGLFTDALGGIWDNKGLIAAMVAGIGALFAAKTVVGALAGAATKTIGNKITGALGLGGDSGEKGDNGRKGAAKAGNAGKGVGSFLGNMGAGVMKGAAAGLKAFTPAVLSGAVIFSGVVVAIGAAISAAAWMLGKTLPTFVDGLKSFEDLDGAALKSAAVGMLALSGAMAAFGAGTAVAGLGAMVGGITGAIGKLFGADDPLEQLKKFAAADIDGAKVKNNADALVAFSNAMAVGAGGAALEGLGAMVSGIAGGIGALFGGKDQGDIFQDMIKFASYDIDVAAVKSNAEAMTAFASAMAVGAGGSAVSGLGTLVSGIAGGIGELFGGEDPITQLVKFSALTIDVAAIKTNAEAMAAFSAAMSGVVMMPTKGIFASFAGAISGLFGGDTPFDQLREFGALQINAAGVKINAEAMGAMSTGLQGFKDISNVEINKNLASRLTDLANIPDLTSFATSVNALASSSLGTGINTLNNLDSSGVLQYTEAMKQLVDVLGELNAELGADNKVGIGTGTNAGDVVGKMDSIGGGSGSGLSAEKLDLLNTTMRSILTILDESRGYHKDTAKAVKSGDLQRGV